MQIFAARPSSMMAARIGQPDRRRAPGKGVIYQPLESPPVSIAVREKAGKRARAQPRVQNRKSPLSRHISQHGLLMHGISSLMLRQDRSARSHPRHGHRVKERYSQMRSSLRRTRAFTLIELLVVIAIIAVLIA